MATKETEIWYHETLLEVDRVPENPKTWPENWLPDPRLFLQNPAWPETRKMKPDPTRNPKIDPQSFWRDFTVFI